MKYIMFCLFAVASVGCTNTDFDAQNSSIQASSSPDRGQKGSGM